MTEKPIEVSAWSGYRGEESPRAFNLNGKRIEVRKVLEQWVEEDAATRVRRRCFRVKGDDFRTHILRCLEVDEVWLHEGDDNNG
jgi:hypothetical protein